MSEPLDNENIGTTLLAWVAYIFGGMWIGQLVAKFKRKPLGRQKH